MITVIGTVTEVGRSLTGVGSFKLVIETDKGESWGALYAYTNTLGVTLGQKVEIIIQPQPTAEERANAALTKVADAARDERDPEIGVEQADEAAVVRSLGGRTVPSPYAAQGAYTGDLGDPDDASDAGAK